MTDHLDHAQIAADQRFAADFMAGRADLTYDDAAPAPQPPPLGASVSHVRSTRLPGDVDQAFTDIARARGVEPGALMREVITAFVREAGTSAPDPVTELRRTLDAAQRALADFTARGFRDAA